MTNQIPWGLWQALDSSSALRQGSLTCKLNHNTPVRITATHEPPTQRLQPQPTSADAAPLSSTAAAPDEVKKSKSEVQTQMYGAELTQWRTDAMEARKRAYELTAEIATERNENARYPPESSGCSASELGGFLMPVVWAGCGRRCGKRRLRLEIPRGRTRRQAMSFSASSLRALQPSPVLRPRWTNWRWRPKNHRQCTKQRCARANAIAQQLPCIPLRLPRCHTRMHICPPHVYSWDVQKDVDQKREAFLFWSPRLPVFHACPGEPHSKVHRSWLSSARMYMC